MILKVNLGTDDKPNWVGVEAENTKQLSGMTLADILLRAKVAANDLIEEEVMGTRTIILKEIETYRSDLSKDLTKMSNQLANKQSAMAGKGLSTNDYTDVDKALVDSIDDFIDSFNSFKASLTTEVVMNHYTDEFTSLDNWLIREGRYNEQLHRIEAKKGSE